MIAGLNQEVEILGRTFHVQTEVSETGIRTEVFLGGKLVATRETPLADEDRGADALRALMQDQHHRIIAGVAERARRYRDRRLEAPVPEPPAPRAPRPLDRPEAAPPAPAVGSVDIGLRIRRLLERFRQRFAEPPCEPGEDVGPCLERAAAAFAWIVASPGFPEIRVDEQVRFHLLQDRIDEWLGSGRDRELGSRLWAEILAFNDYLMEINNRAELAAFDRDLLAWALRRIEREGMSERVVEHLNLVSGRDAELDWLLEMPTGADEEAWTVQLRRVLANLEKA